MKYIFILLLLNHIFAEELRFPTKKQLLAVGVENAKTDLIMKKLRKGKNKSLATYKKLLEVYSKSPESNSDKILQLIRRISNLSSQDLQNKYNKWIILKKNLKTSQLQKILDLQQKTIN